jgi:hypothetical protein
MWRQGLGWQKQPYLGLAEDDVDVGVGALVDIWLGNNEDNLAIEQRRRRAEKGKSGQQPQR